MFVEQLKFILASLNIHLDLNSLQIIQQKYSKNKPQGLDHGQQRVYIYALVAVTCQCHRLPSVINDKNVKTGFSIQNIMQHIPSAQKILFLNYLHKISQLQVFDDCSSIKNKIKEVSRAYKIFIKFQELFQELAEQAETDFCLYKKHMYIFWLLHLYVKQEKKLTLTDYSQQIELQSIVMIFEFLFIKLMPRNDSQKVQKLIGQHFKLSRNLEEKDELQYEYLFTKILKKQYLLRYDISQTFTVQQLLKKNIYLVQRFVDDFSTHYQQKYNNIENQLVDQVTFLELNKTLTPQGFKKQKCEQSISKPLIFDNEDSIDIDCQNDNFIVQKSQLLPCKNLLQENYYSLSKQILDSQNNNQLFNHQSQHLKNAIIQNLQYQLNKSSKEDDKKTSQSLCNLRLKHLQWINSKLNYIEQCQKSLESTLNKIFQNNIQKSFKQYRKSKQIQLILILQNLVPSCLDKTKRTKNIFKLFVYFVQKVQNTVQDEQIFTSIQSFDAFLFVTFIIFNFLCKVQDINYSQYCETFKISKINGFIPINWLGYNADLPNQAKKYLFQLQQKILFSQLWKDESALQLLKSKQTASYRYFSMKKRLLLHVNSKIYQICEDLISQKDKSTIFRFFESLLQNNFDVFYNNNVDIILSCCIYYCFGRNIPFQIIMSKNNRLNPKNLLTFDKFMGKLSICDYYKSIFVHEVQNLCGNSPKKHSHYYTPKTIVSELSQKKNNLTDLKMTSLTFGNSSDRKNDPNGSYREKLRDIYIRNEFKEPLMKDDSF